MRKCMLNFGLHLYHGSFKELGSILNEGTDKEGTVAGAQRHEQEIRGGIHRALYPRVNLPTGG